MSVLSEGRHAGEFLVSEAMGMRSREAVTILSGEDLEAGTILGSVSYGVGKMDIPTVVGTGDGTMSALFAGPEVLPGDYVVECTEAVTNGGVFSITNPNGDLLPSLTLDAGAGNTTDYRSEEINFTITDGSTDFVAGDTFTVTVESGNPTVVGTGNGTLTNLAMQPGIKHGRYRVEVVEAATDGGTLVMTDPDGHLVEEVVISGGAGGTATFDNRQLNGTVTDGATDFAVGDFFEVVVWNEPGKMVVWNPQPSTFDGRHKVSGILFDNTDASAGDEEAAAVVRDAEVNENEIVFPSRTAAEMTLGKNQLKAMGIIPRASDSR